ncbi:hypothetical protein M3P21_14535 [Ruegeria sp. 2012CJ41-6]|uniref:Uncharacterized protein n=1 Tax=Ruegeria spongiae TaxID=2942209 RepID=A0ABT0Q4I8_9RHOB|nr:hypothetical protein [Ruegeria spongiae]MCL6284751.1 hypothetical protein [Ruegeria spongiae]
MKRCFALAALLLASACDIETGEAPKYAFVSPYGPRVNPVNANEFEVILSAGGAFDGYWCGASDYARRKLGAAWTDRVYVASPISQSVTTDRRSAVRFTLDPAALGITPVNKTFSAGLQVGDNMSVTQANTRCSYARPFTVGGRF